MFKLKADPARKLLEIGIDGGFWDLELATAFKVACVEAVASLRCAPGSHVVLVDQRRAVLQSQAVFDWLQVMVRESVAARIALVADSPIARMQTKRYQIRDSVRLFHTMEDAEAWLFADQRDVRAA